jgi:hypothetical protein
VNSFNPAIAECNSDQAHYCNPGTLQHSDTPTLPLPGIEQEHEHEGPCEQLLQLPEYRRLSKTPDSDYQIICKIRDCKWHQCE